MYYRLLIMVVISISVLSCKSDTEMHKVMDEQGNLVEEYERSTKDFSKQGIFKKYYPNGGSIMEIAHYDKDSLHGEHIRFYNNGDTLNVAMMQKGQFEGYFREYYPGNKIMQSYQHVNGAINGRFLEYYESGKLKGDLQFKNNKEDGPFVEYHENGNKSFEGNYKLGKEVGELLKYNEEGELIRKMNCELFDASGVISNICSTTWKAEGEE